ncbi:inosine/xanthosine triphosphatase [Ekhidna lutea]|uniref:Probable inosine/xanthosine triphosphatase n=1 Tax=Ekhidna lutea TaxID=447679 RepID=A0A239F237_EKHLU|nr:inosine/xanthosine triphosphatase [Ekhidna lutea]SNS51070.1 inosine/xanthosine triphosphatase [Ekhidna lutea]
MKVIVASKNPVKINATQLGFGQVFPNERFDIEGIAVPSGVSDQPMTNGETLQGAKNRAEQAKIEIPEAGFWVGIEGGIEETVEGMEAFAWVVILAKNQKGQSRTSTFFLPPKVRTLVLQGAELGHANDQVFEDHNSKQKGGAVGSLTNGLLGRTAYYEQAVILALIPFVKKEIY